jgi:hypothetical protein
LLISKSQRWCSVRRRAQFCIALLSIALQATDLLLGGWGHTHHHDAVVAHSCYGDCDGHDHGDLADEPHDESPADSHDDCSLCRHFSQPVAPASIEIAAIECEYVAPLFFQLISAAGIDAEIEHPARGPPVSVA